MLQEIMKWQRDRNLDKMVYNHTDELLNVLEEVGEVWGHTSRDTMKEFMLDLIGNRQLLVTPDECIDAYFDIIVYSIGSMMKLGYDVPSVIMEGLKEINSRGGSYSVEEGKWKKEITGNEYKADYSKCRLN